MPIWIRTITFLMIASQTSCLAMPTLQPNTKSAITTNSFYIYQKQNMHFASAGNPQKPLVLFIHGTPGSWQAYEYYLAHSELNKLAHMVAVDRLGFGLSANADIDSSLAVQAASLKPLFEKNTSAYPVIIVGHSLGGTIAARMALDYQEQIGGIILIASSLSAKLGKARWYNHFAATPIVRWFVPNNLKRANQEILPLEHELQKLAPRWKELQIPVTIIHGKKDKLVSFKNTEFAVDKLYNSRVDVVAENKAGHFILWKKPELIINAIKDMLKTAQDQQDTP